METIERVAWKPVEAAAALGVGKSLMYEWIAAGVIRSYRIGARLRIPADEIRRIAEEGLPVSPQARTDRHEVAVAG